MASTAPQRLSSETIDILKNVSFRGNNVVLNSGQLECHLYTEVNSVLERIGGHWQGGKTSAHIFSYNPQPAIKAVVEIGVMPPKNPTSFFPTPTGLIEKMVEDSFCDFLLRGIADGTVEGRILEPEAGTGGIIRFLLERYPGLKGKIDAIEIDPVKVEVLRELDAGKVFTGDFMHWIPQGGSEEYRVILMNPPFSSGGNRALYADHIKHACDIVAAQDKIAFISAIAPTGFLYNTSKAERGFRDLAYTYGTVEINGKGLFKSVGTNIDTVVINMEINPHEPPMSMKPICGHRSWHAHNFFLFVDNDQEFQSQVTRCRTVAAFEAFAEQVNQKLIAAGSGISLALEIMQSLVDEIREEHPDFLAGEPPFLSDHTSQLIFSPSNGDALYPLSPREKFQTTGGIEISPRKEDPQATIPASPDAKMPFDTPPNIKKPARPVPKQVESLVPPAAVIEAKQPKDYQLRLF